LVFIAADEERVNASGGKTSGENRPIGCEKFSTFAKLIMAAKRRGGKPKGWFLKVLEDITLLVGREHANVYKNAIKNTG